MESGRLQDRTRVSLDVALEESGRQVFTPTLNLSASGVLLACEQPPAVGTHVSVVMSLPPTGVFVRLQGEVVRHAREIQRPAFAVVFRAVDEATREQLEGFVARVARA